MVYGDDIGLSMARARRAMEFVKPRLALNDKQAEFDGRGYVQTDDVVNAGFIESDVSRVEVQVVYDELAILDELEGVDIQRMKREVSTTNPYALNYMRITVITVRSTTNKSIPDVRAADVALEKADVQFSSTTSTRAQCHGVATRSATRTTLRPNWPKTGSSSAPTATIPV
jgi:hypothetical protein